MYDDGVTNLPSVSSGPDRIYNEIYDFGPGDFNKIPVGCPYIYGFGTNEIGWDVKAPEKEGCTPVSPFVPDYKGTTNVLTTNSKYYTLANYSGGPNPSLDPARYIFPGDSSDPLAF